MDDREKIKTALLEFAGSLGLDNTLRDAKKTDIVKSFEKKGKARRTGKKFTPPQVDAAKLTGMLTEYASSLGTTDEQELATRKENVLKIANDQFQQEADLNNLTDQEKQQHVEQKTTMLQQYMNGIDDMFMSETERQRRDVEKSPLLSEEVQQYIDSKIEDISTQVNQMRSGRGSNGGGGTVAVQYREGGKFEGNIKIDGSVKPPELYSSPEALELLDAPAISVTQHNTDNTIAEFNHADGSNGLIVHSDKRVDIGNDLTVFGDISATGAIHIKTGSLSLTGDVLPDQDRAFDLGAPTKRWENAYIYDIDTSQLHVQEKLEISNPSGNAEFLFDGASFQVRGNASFDSFGDSLIPSTDLTHDIGTPQKRWTTLYVNSVSASGDSFIGASNTDTLYIDASLGTNLVQKSGESLELGTVNTPWFKTHTNNLHVTNSTQLSGNTVIGAPGASTVVTINSQVNSNVIPDTNNTYALGSNSNRWSKLWSVDADVSNNLSVGGNTTLGTDHVDTVTFRADVNSDILPETDVTHDLGAVDKQWDELFVQDISASNTVKIGNDLEVADDTTISGNIAVSGTSTLSGDVHVYGDLRVDGNTYLSAGSDGNIYIGDADTDNVVFTADVDSSIEPDDDVTYNLGSPSQQWKTLFVQDVSASRDVTIDNNLSVSGNTVLGTDNTDSVVFHADVDSDIEPDDSQVYDLGNALQEWKTLFVQDISASRDVDIGQHLNVAGNAHIQGDLRVDGNTYLSAGSDGNIYIGDSDGDNVVFTADVDSNILPDDDVTYDLGSVSKKWETLHVQNVSATNNLSVSGSTILGSDNTDNVTFRADVNSNILPNTTQQHDLGSDAQQWQELFVQDISASRDVFIDRHLDVDGNTDMQGDLHVHGDLRVDGNAYLSAGEDGNIYVGDVDTDNVIFRADVDSGIKPDDHQTYDLGTDEQQWKTLFVQDISASRDVFIDRHLDVDGNTDMQGDLHVHGDLRVDGNAYLSAGSDGNIYVGDVDTDNVVFRADVDSGIKPDDHQTYDLGTDAQQWKTLFVQDVSASRDVDIGQDLYVTRDATVDADTHIKGNLTVDGNVTLSGGDDGVITLGDRDGDNVVFMGDIQSDIIPNSNHDWDLGRGDKQWKTLFVRDVSASGNLTVDNNTVLEGDVQIGTDENDRVVFESLVDSDMIPNYSVDGLAYNTDIIDGTAEVGDVDMLFDDDLSTWWGTGVTTGPANVIMQINLIEKFVGFDEFEWRYAVNVSGGTRRIEVLDINDSTWKTVANDDFSSGSGGSGSRIVGGTLDASSPFQTMSIGGIRVVFIHPNVLVSTNFRNFELKFKQNGVVIDWRFIRKEMDLGRPTNPWKELHVIDARVTEQLTVSGNTQLGTDQSDNVSFDASIASDFIPNTDNQHDLGANDKRWGTLHVRDVSASNNCFCDGNMDIGQLCDIDGDLTVKGNSILGDGDDTITIDGSTVITGAVELQDDVHIRGDLRVDGNAYLSAGSGGIIHVGDNDDDIAVFNSNVGSDILPNTDGVHDLGASDAKWNTLHVQTVTTTLDVNVGGDTVLGNASTDQVTFNADINSDILPSQNQTHSLGNAGRQWNEIHAKSLAIDTNTTIGTDLTVEGNFAVNGLSVLGTDEFDTVTINSRVDSSVHPKNSLTYDLGTTGLEWRELHIHDIHSSGDVSIGGDIAVTGGATINGHVILGNTNTDNVTFNADVNSDIIPDNNQQYTLGTSAKRWKTLHVQDISATNDVAVDDNLTVGGDFTVSGHTSLGVTDQDIVTINGEISGDIIPDNHEQYNLGKDDKRWGTVYATTANIPSAEIDDITANSVTSNTFISGGVDLSQEFHTIGQKIEGLYSYLISNSDNNIVDNTSADFDQFITTQWPSVSAATTPGDTVTISNTNTVYILSNKTGDTNDDWHEVNLKPNTLIYRTGMSDGFVVDTIPAGFKSAKYVVEITFGADVYFAELTIVTNGTTASVMTYGVNHTTVDPVVSFNANINAGAGNACELQIQSINGFTGLNTATLKANRTNLF